MELYLIPGDFYPVHSGVLPSKEPSSTIFFPSENDHCGIERTLPFPFFIQYDMVMSGRISLLIPASRLSDQEAGYLRGGSSYTSRFLFLYITGRRKTSCPLERTSFLAYPVGGK